MKKSKKSKLALILLAALLLNAMFTGCSDSTNGDASTTDTVNQSVIQEETEAETSALEALPTKDFGGTDYHMLGDVNSNWWIISLASEETTGEIINDTVYERNEYVAEKYNVTISHTPTNSLGSDLKNSVESGSDDYDVVWERLNNIITSAQSGHLLDMNQMTDVFNYEAPWWDTDSVRVLAINGRLFYACNDINVHTMEGCSALYFAKNLVANHSLENPYTMVREKTWTLDKMAEMIETVSSDTNGDGQRNKGDTFGMITGIGQYLSLINGGGDQLVVLEHGTDGDMFTLNLATENVISLTEKVCAMLNDKNKSVIVNDDAWGYDSFYEGESLFYIMQLGSVMDIRDKMEYDFGILPFPMKDEAQGYYTTSMEATAQAMGIPSSVKELDMVKYVTEAMAVYSDEYLIDAFYDTTLKGKIARDADTVEMLDILTGTRTFDYSTVYGTWGVYSKFLDNIRQKGGSDLGSFTASLEKSFKKVSERTIESYAGIQ